MRQLALVLALLCVPARARADDWLGPDKKLHFAAAGGIAVAGYGGAALVFDHRWERAAIGGGLAIAAGAAKEGWDATGRGDPSIKDFTWDVIGAAVGVAVAWGVDWVIGRLRHPRPARQP